MAELARKDQIRSNSQDFKT